MPMPMMTTAEKKQFKLSLAVAAKNGIDQFLGNYRRDNITARIDFAERLIEIRVVTPGGPVYFEVQVKERF